MTYTAVIFDFGGVITTSPLEGMRSYCDASGVPMEAIRSLFNTRGGAWERFETNAISQDEFVTAFEHEAAAHGYTVDGRDFLTAFFGGTTLRPGMVAVVRALREHYKIGCITNNIRTSLRERQPLFDELFDVLVESSKVGLRKPDPAIYRLACAELGVDPRETVFLDDFGVNLKAARALGMATIKVDASDSAIHELERVLGIELPRTPAVVESQSGASNAILEQAVGHAAAVLGGIPDAALGRSWRWQQGSADVDLRWGLYRLYEGLQELATRVWTARPAPTFTQRALAPYQIAYRDLCGLLQIIEEHDLDKVPAEGEWPLRQVLGHMLSTEWAFIHFITYAVERRRSGDDRPERLDRAALIERAQQEGVEPDAATGSLSEIRQRVAMLHERAIRGISGLRQADLAAPLVIWFRADVRLLLFRFDAHLREHTIQAEKVLEVVRPHPTDAQRTIRLIYRALGEVEAALIGAPATLMAARVAFAGTIRDLAAELAQAAALSPSH